nr:lysophospholipid acyltransferase family protein [Candidatus Sigynarchaeota archaeon]
MKPFQRIICELVDVFIAARAERLLSWVINLGLYLFFKICNNFSIVGKKYIPKNKNFLLVGNHSSAADAYLLSAALTGRFCMQFWYMANASWRFDDPFFSRLMRLSGALPRRGAGAEIVKKMVKVIVDPKRRRVAIPPEGTFNTGGKIMHGFTGVVRVYHEANKRFRIPILPVVSIGAAEAYPAEKKPNEPYLPKKRHGIIGRIGKPFYLPRPASGIMDRDFLRTQTDFIIERLRRLAMQKEPLAENAVLEKVRERQDEQSRIYTE